MIARMTKVAIGLVIVGVCAMFVGSLVLVATCNHHAARMVVTVPEDFDVPFNVPPGERLDILMYPPELFADTQRMADRCDTMGGELIYSPTTLLWVCEDVDH